MDRLDLQLEQILATTPGISYSKKIYRAQFFKSLKAIGQAEIIKNGFEVLLGQLMADLGFTKSNYDESLKNADRIASMVIQKFHWLTMQDIQLAFEMYVAKEYDDMSKIGEAYQKLSTVFVLDILQQYHNERQRRIQSIRKLLPADPDPDPTAMEILIPEITLRTNFVLPAYQKFCSKEPDLRMYDFVLPTIYWSIRGIKGFLLTTEEQAEIWNLAKAAIKTKNALKKKTDFDLLLIAADKAKNSNNGTSNQETKNKAYSIAAIRGFQYFKDNNVNLAEELSLSGIPAEGEEAKFIINQLESLRFPRTQRVLDEESGELKEVKNPLTFDQVCKGVEENLRIPLHTIIATVIKSKKPF